MSIGQISNHMSTDATNVYMMFQSINNIVALPIQARLFSCVDFIKLSLCRPNYTLIQKSKIVLNADSVLNQNVFFDWLFVCLFIF